MGQSAQGAVRHQQEKGGKLAGEGQVPIPCTPIPLRLSFILRVEAPEAF